MLVLFIASFVYSVEMAWATNSSVLEPSAKGFETVH